MYDLIYVIKKYNSSRDSYCSSKLHLSFGWTQDAELNDLRTMIEGMRQQSGVNLAQISEAGKLFFFLYFSNSLSYAFSITGEPVNFICSIISDNPIDLYIIYARTKFLRNII